MSPKLGRFDGSQSRVLAYLLAVDLVIGIGLTVASLAYLEVLDLAAAVGLCAFVYALHLAVWVAYLRHAWAPVHAWERRPSIDDGTIRTADATIERLPVRLVRVYAVSWGIYWTGIATLAWFWFPDVIEIGRYDLVAIAFEIVASLIGASVLFVPLVRLLLRDTKAKLGAVLASLGIDPRRDRQPLASSYVALALGMALAPVTWQFGTTWQAHAHEARELTQLELGHAVEAAAAAIEAGGSLTAEGHTLVDARGLPARLGDAEPESIPVGATLVELDRRTEQAFAATRLADGRWVVGQAAIEIAVPSFWIGTFGLIVAVVGWVLVTAGGSVRLLSQPLLRLDDAVRRVVEVGDLHEIGRIPIAHDDEIGGLSRRFNAMLDLFDELASAAKVVSEGQLQVQLSGRGDLQTAFAGMIDRLRELTSEVHTASTELASVAAEIHATALTQEQVMSLQAHGIGEASEALQRLSESAGAITSAAIDVLGNAEQARGHSDAVGAKIAELTGNLGRIGQLLEQIGEIADRSDLLALNGSLEAVRAGEAGRGFALVATEMRRLAERVTVIVRDVRTTITDIEVASAASVTATEAGRRLTTETTDAARLIVEVTESQGAETELVSASVHEIAAVVSQTVATTAQIRAAADGLREQAISLEHVIRDFAIESADGPGRQS